MSWIALGALLGGCISPVIPIGGGKSARQAQRDTMNTFTPAQLEVEHSWTGAVRLAKVRVWADDEYRAQNVRWQQTFGESLEHTNAVLASTFGVRLQPEYRSWDRHAPGASLEESCVALAAVDPGEDVLVVVGLTSSMGLVSATFDQLGLAMSPGRHLVVRGYASVEETNAFAEAFPKVPVEERNELLKDRRRHKSATVLLHELGHNFGADHETESETIMNRSYSERAARFSASSRDLILRTLEERLSGARPRAAVAETAPVPATPASTRPAVARSSITVQVTPKGALLIDGVVLDDGALERLLRARFAEDPDAEITVYKDHKAPPDALVRLIDRAKAIGLYRISIHANPR